MGLAGRTTSSPASASMVAAIRDPTGEMTQGELGSADDGEQRDEDDARRHLVRRRAPRG